MLLGELLETAHRMKFLKTTDMHRVAVDTTVQEKTVNFHTDCKLYNKGSELLVEKAQEEGTNLWRTYSRLGPEPLLCRDVTGEPVKTRVQKKSRRT